MKEPQVQDVMTNLVVTFQLDQSLREAAERLLMHRISGGPVIDAGKVVGVISESDIARALTPVGGEGRSLLVRDSMSEKVVTVGPSTGLWTAARLINRHGIKRLPVVDDEGYLVGILARADLLRAVADLDSELAG